MAKWISCGTVGRLGLEKNCLVYISARHVKIPRPILTKIDMRNNVVDVTRQAKLYRAPFWGFAPHIRDFRTIWMISL